MMYESAALQRENTVVLNIVQALLDLMSNEIKAVSTDVSPTHIVVHFAVCNATAETYADIEDIIFELEVFLGDSFESAPLAVSSEVYVGQPNSNWPGHKHRMIYRAKE